VVPLVQLERAQKTKPRQEFPITPITASGGKRSNLAGSTLLISWGFSPCPLRCPHLLTLSPTDSPTGTSSPSPPDLFLLASTTRDVPLPHPEIGWLTNTTGQPQALKKLTELVSMKDPPSDQQLKNLVVLLRQLDHTVINPPNTHTQKTLLYCACESGHFQFAHELLHVSSPHHLFWMDFF
jgi:hypothetical protein